MTHLKKAPQPIFKDRGGIPLDGTNYYKYSGELGTGTSGAVSVWVKINTLDGSNVTIWGLGGDDVSTPGAFNLRVKRVSGKDYFRFQVKNDGQPNPWNVVDCRGLEVQTDTWYRVTVISTGTEWKIYINGTLQTLTVAAGSNTGDWWGDVSYTNGVTSVGALYYDGMWQDHLDGEVKHFAVWSSDISSDEGELAVDGEPANLDSHPGTRDEWFRFDRGDYGITTADEWTYESEDSAKALTGVGTDEGDYDIILGLTIGQSNSSGGMLLTGLQTTYQSDHANELVWNGTKIVEIDHSTNNNQYPTGNSKFGMEFAFLRRMRERFNKPTCLVKHALGGTGLDTSFDPDWNTATTGEYFDDAKATWDNALQYALDLGLTVRIAFVDWNQGEKDSSVQSAANNYEANEQDVADEIMAHTGAEVYWTTLMHKDLPSGSYPYRTTVNTGKTNVAATDADYSTYNQDSLSQQADKIHLDADGYEDMGIAKANLI